eukprot:jgi/Antlo1/1794/1409
MESNGLEPFSENNLWSETDERWNYSDVPVDAADWRVVGSRTYKPARHRLRRRTKSIPSSVSRGKENARCENDHGKENRSCGNFHSSEEHSPGSVRVSAIRGADLVELGHAQGKAAEREYRRAIGLCSRDAKKYQGKNTCFEPRLLVGQTLYIIEFESKRLDIGFTTESIGIGVYVILEADRGEDCGRIKFMTSLERYMSLIETYPINDEIIPKRILRVANSEDLKILARKKELEGEALKYCMARNYLDMEVVSCEYQWDMKKLTFFFVSDDRVDFRELVKDLYKTYKTRIWMCCVDKSKNWCLKTLMCEQI